jgi:hypothetical protein
VNLFSVRFFTLGENGSLNPRGIPVYFLPLAGVGGQLSAEYRSKKIASQQRLSCSANAFQGIVGHHRKTPRKRSTIAIS